MVGYWDLCTNAHDDPTQCFFEIVNSWPLFVPFATTAVSFVRRDIYLLTFSLGSWINTVLSFVCVSFASAASQSAAWLITMILFLVLFYRLRLNIINAFYMTAFLALALYANIYLRTNSHGELYIGAMLGTVNAVIQSIIVLVVVYPYSDILYTSNKLTWVELMNDYMSMRRIFYLPETLHPIENIRLVLRLHTLEDTFDAIDRIASTRKAYASTIRYADEINSAFRRDL